MTHPRPPPTLPLPKDTNPKEKMLFDDEVDNDIDTFVSGFHPDVAMATGPDGSALLGLRLVKAKIRTWRLASPSQCLPLPCLLRSFLPFYLIA